MNRLCLGVMVSVVIIGTAWRFGSIDVEQAIFKEKMQLPFGSTKAQTALILGKSFLGNDYVAHTLEQTPEQLVCNLRTFDCYTFVESVLAMTLTRHHLKTYLQYQILLRQMRYREGKMEGYASRLHYFLEWKNQGEASGWYTDVTQQLGGEVVQPPINFMTKHRSLYPALESNIEFEKVEEVEKKLSAKPWYLIPKNKVAAIENDLQDGDIIGITSGIAGLDFNHEGFVIKKANKAYLLHASSEAKKVVISSETLSEYLQRVKKHSGIVVLRIRN